MDGYVVELQNWLAGILNWHRDCRRYGAADLARRAHGFVPGRLPTVPGGVPSFRARHPPLCIERGSGNFRGVR